MAQRDGVALPAGTRLFRLIRMAEGSYFDGVWWMPEAVSLPVGDVQLCVVEIELTQKVFGWVGKSSPLFERPGGMEQVFLPNLAERGNPRASVVAQVVHTYWLRF